MSGSPKFSEAEIAEWKQKILEEMRQRRAELEARRRQEAEEQERQRQQARRVRYSMKFLLRRRGCLKDQRRAKSGGCITVDMVESIQGRGTKAQIPHLRPH